MPIENQTHFANDCCIGLRFNESDDEFFYEELLDYIPVEIVVSKLRPNQAAAFVNGTPGFYLSFYGKPEALLQDKGFYGHKKLNLHVTRGEKIRFYLSSSIAKSDAISQLNHSPILITKTSSDVLSIHAPVHWQVVRSHRDEQEVTHNPFSLPYYIENLTTVECDEDISLKEIDSYLKSIKFKIEVLERFKVMTFTPKIKERIEQGLYEQESNYQEVSLLKHKREQQLIFSNTYQKQLLSLLKDEVDDATYLQLHKKAVNEANNAPTSTYPISSAESIYEKMKTLSVHQQISNLLAQSEISLPPIHKCSDCDSEAVAEKVNKSGKKFFIHCTNCCKSLSENSASKQKHISIVNWNSANCMQLDVINLSPFKLARENTNEQLTDIENYLILAKRRLSIIANDVNKKKSTSAKEELFKVSILFQWALYIRENN